MKSKQALRNLEQKHSLWKLEMRGARGTPFIDLGSFASINDAAGAILKTENSPSAGVFFRVYAEPSGELAPTDKDVLSRLDYRSETRYYVLTRTEQ